MALTDSSWPMTAGERYEFDLRGYIVRRAALPPEMVRSLRLAVVDLGHQRAGESIESQRFSGFLDQHDVFRDLIDHGAVLEPLLDLCGPTVRLDHCYGISMRPGTAGLGLHGGGTPHDPAQYYRVEHGRMFNGLVAVQWALVDHRPGDGGFGCIPGSHKASFSFPGSMPELVAEVPMAAGDVVIFTEALTHCTVPWSGTGDRLALLYKYAPGHLAWSPNDLTALAPLLSERQRRFVQRPAVHGHKTIRGNSS